MRALFTHSCRFIATSREPSRTDSPVLHRPSYDAGSRLAQSSATRIAATRTLALPNSLSSSERTLPVLRRI